MTNERRFTLLAYDISDDSRRAKIARKMEAVGERVQGSVFEAYLTASEVESLLKKSQKWMDLKEDSLRVYFLCAECREKIITWGQGSVTPPPGVVIV